MIINSRLKIFLVSFFVLYNVCAFAQNNDMQLWTNISVEKKLTKTFSLNYAEEVRFNENISEVGQFFSDLGGTYKISKTWRISVNYRFTNKRQLDDSYSKRHRYYFDLSYKKKFDRIIFLFRTRFQSQCADINCSDDGKIPDYYSRNKVTFKFDFDKKYIPYISAEMFYQLNNPDGNVIDNMRYAGGVEYQFNKRASLDLFYLIQQEYNCVKPERDFVIGVGYNYSF
jgi:hypothetical protein